MLHDRRVADGELGAGVYSACFGVTYHFLSFLAFSFVEENILFIWEGGQAGGPSRSVPVATECRIK